MNSQTKDASKLVGCGLFRRQALASALPKERPPRLKQDDTLNKSLVLEFDPYQKPMQLWINPTEFFRMLKNLVKKTLSSSQEVAKIMYKLLGGLASAQELE